MLLENILIKNKNTETYRLVNIEIQDTLIKSIIVLDDNVKDFNNVNYYATRGFVNCHLHPNQLFDRRLMDHLSISELLSNMHINYRKTFEDRYYQAVLVLLDSVRSGSLINYSVASNPEPVIKAYKDLGIMGAVTCFYNDVWEGYGNPPKIDNISDIEENYKTILKEQNENFSIHIGSASIESASNELLVFFNEISKKYETKVNIHIAEGVDSINSCLKNRGKTPIKLLQDLNVLNENWNLIHVVNVTEEELSIIAKSNARVIHCPVSNAKTGVGIALLKKMLDKGVVVGLGTDACSNNNTNNILSEAYFTSLIHSASNKDAHLFNVNTLMEMLTDRGNSIVKNSINNVIEAENKANILLWNLKDISFVPLNFRNLDSAIIYNAPDIKPIDVIVDGQLMIQDYKYLNIDIQSIIHKINHLSKKISNSVF